MSFHAVESGNSVLLLLSHSEGAKSDVILELVKNAVKSAEAVAAELEFDALENESLIAVLYGKDAKSFNTALYNVYANPVNTPGLALDGGMHAGFKFEVYASS
ncbi:MAG: fructose 1,6-bisphosphatase, partial [Candidatus Altiarchaeota archaeon]|nr:fructose 1,6-bisphosphatase [Candidatus Altiarchaeota archaeon]